MLPTQWKCFIKTSRIGFLGNQVNIFISSGSESFTEFKTLFEIQKIPIEKNELLGIQPKYKWMFILVISRTNQNKHRSRTKPPCPMDFWPVNRIVPKVHIERTGQTWSSNLLVDSALPLPIFDFQRRKYFFRKKMRKEAPLSEFKRKDGMISLEHCQEWNCVCYRNDVIVPYYKTDP